MEDSGLAAAERFAAKLKARTLADALGYCANSSVDFAIVSARRAGCDRFIRIAPARMFGFASSRRLHATAQKSPVGRTALGAGFALLLLPFRRAIFHLLLLRRQLFGSRGFGSCGFGSRSFGSRRLGGGGLRGCDISRRRGRRCSGSQRAG